MSEGLSMGNLQEIFEKMIPSFQTILGNVLERIELFYMVLLQEEHRQKSRILI